MHVPAAVVDAGDLQAQAGLGQPGDVGQPPAPLAVGVAGSPVGHIGVVPVEADRAELVHGVQGGSGLTGQHSSGVAVQRLDPAHQGVPSRAPVGVEVEVVQTRQGDRLVGVRRQRQHDARADGDRPEGARRLRGVLDVSSEPPGTDVGDRRPLAEVLVLEVGAGDTGVPRAQHDRQLVAVPERLQRTEIGVEQVLRTQRDAVGDGDPRPCEGVGAVVHRCHGCQSVEAAAQEDADEHVPSGVGGEGVAGCGRGREQPAQPDQGAAEQSPATEPRPGRHVLHSRRVDAAVGPQRDRQGVRLGGGDDPGASVDHCEQPVAALLVVVQGGDEVLVEERLAPGQVLGPGHRRPLSGA